MQSPESIHWRLLLGNPYRYSIHKAMLSDEGYKIATMARQKGMSKTEPLKPFVIHFDREFVIEKLKRELLNHLNPANYNELQKIVGEAYKQWKV